MNDEKLLIIVFLGMAILTPILLTLDMFINKIRYKKILKKYPALQKHMDEYYYWINKQANYYNAHIAPTQKRIDNIRNKIPTATINEYKQYSDDIEHLEKTIKDFRKKSQEYTLKAVHCKYSINDIKCVMTEKERKIFKNNCYNSFN